MAKDTFEPVMEFSAYLFRTVELGDDLKTPLLLLYPWREVLEVDLSLPPPVFEGVLEVLSIPTGRRVRASLSIPGGDGGINREIIRMRSMAYLSGKPLQGTLTLGGEKFPLVVPPPQVPPARGYHTTIFEGFRISRGGRAYLYTAHTATPENSALHLYSGADVVDNLGVIRGVLEGHRYRAGRGIERPRAGWELTEEELKGVVEDATEELIRSLEGAYEEAIHGDLRLAVEVDSSKSVENSLWLRDLDERYHEDFERWAPAINLKRWDLPSRDSLRRPQVRRWALRLKNRYRPPQGKSILLLLPCSATKPYSNSPSHRAIKAALRGVEGLSRVHQVILTSPLGVVPRELEELQPAVSYEVPVRGRWFPEEKQLIRELLSVVMEKGDYTRAFWLLPSKELYEAVEDLGEVENLLGRDGWNLGRENLRRAVDTLKEALDGMEDIKEMRLREETSSLIFQMGEAAASFESEAKLLTRRDRREIVGPEGRLCQFLEGRGKHYLTLRGGQRLHEAHLKGLQAPLVEIEDFFPKGKVFLQGIIKAEESIRPGDEVVVVHEGEVRAVGEASLPGAELRQGFYRGMGVKVREALEG